MTEGNDPESQVNGIENRFSDTQSQIIHQCPHDRTAEAVRQAGPYPGLWEKRHGDPKKALYNKVYRKTNFGLSDLLKLFK